MVVSDAPWVQVETDESMAKPVKERMLLFMIFCITFEVAEVQAYLRKSGSSLPVKWNYLVKN